MDRRKIKKILRNVKSGDLNINKAFEELKSLPYEDLGFTKIDTHREIRKGFPEVIFCEGKTLKQMVGIFKKLKKSSFVMATRANKEKYKAVKNIRKDAIYYEKAGIIFAGKKKKSKKRNKPILVLSAGTSDIPVAEEAAVTAEVLGNKVERVYDIGAAGIHRMLSKRSKIEKASVIIVVAGMDAVLPTLVGGLASCPVIAVPTSVGYGANFKGLAALLTVLNSCAPGVAAVNIDNGFGAGYMSSLINNK